MFNGSNQQQPILFQRKEGSTAVKFAERATEPLAEQGQAMLVFGRTGLVSSPCKSPFRASLSGRGGAFGASPLQLSSPTGSHELSTRLSFGLLQHQLVNAALRALGCSRYGIPPNRFDAVFQPPLPRPSAGWTYRKAHSG